MNKKGNLLMGVIMGFIVLVFLTMTVGIISSLFNSQKGANQLNCQGYVDPHASGPVNNSYNPNLNSDDMTCSVINFGTAFWTIAILSAIVIGVISGNLGNEQQQQPMNYGYQ
jgi:hypothetical protein